MSLALSRNLHLLLTKLHVNIFMQNLSLIAITEYKKIMREENQKTTGNGNHNLSHNLKTGILGAGLTLAAITGMAVNANAQTRTNPVRSKPTTGQTVKTAIPADTIPNTSANQSGAPGTSGFFTNTSDAANISPNEDFRSATNVAITKGADSTTVKITYDLGKEHKSITAIADPYNFQQNIYMKKKRLGNYFIKTKNEKNELSFVPFRATEDDDSNTILRPGTGSINPHNFIIYYNKALEVVNKNLEQQNQQQR